MEAAALKAELQGMAASLGFPRMGVARAGVLGPEGERLRAWLADGKHGEMSWMNETAEVRIDPAHERMLPSVRSIVVFAVPYARSDERVGPAPGRVARYARGRDYHTVLGKRLRKVAKWLREQGHETRVAVDSVPVFERAWAQRAGLGFIGKNACLIVPGMGSHLFLASLLTSAELPADEPMRERCGDCTLCLEGCPTSAFEGPRTLDARKCISYLTIEQEGAIDEALRAQMGDWIFGCDVCQDVCPWNRTALPDAEATAAFAPDARWAAHDAPALLAMDDEAFTAYAEGSPVKRPGREGMARNAAIVLGNAGDKRHLPLLERTAREHDSPTVRDAAVWAAGRLRSRT